MQGRYSSPGDFKADLSAQLADFPEGEYKKPFLAYAVLVYEHDPRIADAIHALIHALEPIKQTQPDLLADELYRKLFSWFAKYGDGLSVTKLVDSIHVAAVLVGELTPESDRLRCLNLVNTNKKLIYDQGLPLLRYLKESLTSAEARNHFLANYAAIDSLLRLGFQIAEPLQWPVFQPLSTIKVKNFSPRSHLLDYLLKHELGNWLAFLKIDDALNQFMDIHGMTQASPGLINLLKECLYQHHQVMSLVEGPINLSRSTQLFSDLLMTLVSQPFSAITLREEGNGNYYIKLTDWNHEINLSKLLRSINLSHVILSDAEVENIDLALKQQLDFDLLANFNQAIEDGILPRERSVLLMKLPLALQAAIYEYSHEEQRTINPLYRGEKVEGEMSLPRLLKALYLGVLLSEALRRFPMLLDGHQHGIELLERAEKYDIEASIPHRYAKVSAYSTVLSTSVPGGVYTPNFNPQGVFIKTTLFGPHLHGIRVDQLSRHPREHEVILPPGTKMRITAETRVSPTVIHHQAKVVSSPSFEPLSYFSHLAITRAYDDHLARPFKDRPHHLTIQSQCVHRPAHGLAHAYRVMRYIPLVMAYFNAHCADPGLQDYFSEAWEHHQDCLMIMAAYFQTGRESDESYRYQPALHQSYRLASAKNLEGFMRTLPPSFFVEDKTSIIERCSYVLTHLHAHEKFTETEPAYRYYHWVIAYAVALDFQRNFSIASYQKAFEPFASVIQASPEARRDFFHLEGYVAEWLSETGDRSQFEVIAPGEYRLNPKDYQPCFVRANQSVEWLNQVALNINMPLRDGVLRCGSEGEVADLPVASAGLALAGRR